MEIIFELIFGLVLETVLGIIGEALVALGFHAVADQFSGGTGKPFVIGFAYALFGFALGALSLMILPKFAFGNRAILVIYFILSPIIAGLALCVVNWIMHRGINQVRLFQFAKFLQGAIFVLVFSSTRSVFG